MTYDGRTVGKCTVIRCGLYYQFSCRCEKLSDDISRLYLRCGGIEISLGVLAPFGNGINLEKRMAARCLPAGKPEFVIKTAGQADEEIMAEFIPVRENEPFPYLSRLEAARYMRRNGEPGVILK